MKILAPLKQEKETIPLIEAGADELYCGVMAEKWRGSYTNMASMNRRYSKTANLDSVEELKKVCKTAGEVPVYLTLNEQYYTEKQQKELLGSVKETEGLIAAVILTDLGLLEKIKEKGIDIHISTGGTSFNSETVEFYKELGAKRVILPRQLRIEEIKEISGKTKGIELETFAMNTKCPNIDGFCTFQHGLNEVIRPKTSLLKKARLDFHLMDWMQGAPEWLQERIKGMDLMGSTSACYLNYDISMIKGDEKTGVQMKKRQQQETFKNHCAGCALYELKEYGIESVKIVGRENPLKKKLRDVRYLKRLKDALEEGIGEKEFTELAKKTYIDIYGRKCMGACYY